MVNEFRSIWNVCDAIKMCFVLTLQLSLIMVIQQAQQFNAII